MSVPSSRIKQSKKNDWGSLTLEDGTDILTRSIGNQLKTDAV
jgi:hypothetical protein